MINTQAVASKTKHSPYWYKRLFAWLMAHGMTKYETEMADQKRALFADLHGNILEIGPGTGPNLSYYPSDIHWIGIEPNPYMHSYLQQKAEQLGLDIELSLSTAEHLDVEDNSIDAVVSTLVLCSVDNLAVVLKEILRVLKPGGRFFFIEHVAAQPGTLLRQTQHCIQPLWTVIGDGCHPDRDTGIALENAGFERVDYQHFRADVLPIVSPQIIGVAIKKAVIV